MRDGAILRPIGGGWLEGACYCCGESLLYQAHEPLHTYVGSEGRMLGVLCLKCFLAGGGVLSVEESEPPF